VAIEKDIRLEEVLLQKRKPHWSQRQVKKKSPTEICRAIEKDWGDMSDLEEKSKPYDRWNGNQPKECIGKCAG